MLNGLQWVTGFLSPGREPAAFNLYLLLALPFMSTLICYTSWNINFQCIRVIFIFAVGEGQGVGSKNKTLTPTQLLSLIMVWKLSLVCRCGEHMVCTPEVDQHCMCTAIRQYCGKHVVLTMFCLFSLSGVFLEHTSTMRYFWLNFSPIWEKSQLDFISSWKQSWNMWDERKISWDQYLMKRSNLIEDTMSHMCL